LLFDLEINFDFTGSDHAGPALTFGIFGYVLIISVCDRRHWNYDEHRWQDKY
jgi:hypothetical protein